MTDNEEIIPNSELNKELSNDTVFNSDLRTPIRPNLILSENSYPKVSVNRVNEKDDDLQSHNSNKNSCRNSKKSSFILKISDLENSHNADINRKINPITTTTNTLKNKSNIDISPEMNSSDLKSKIELLKKKKNSEIESMNQVYDNEFEFSPIRSNLNYNNEEMNVCLKEHKSSTQNKHELNDIVNNE